MTITNDIQKLEPGELVELFELDATAIGGDLQRFHGYMDSGIVTWQGNPYSPWPIEASGFERTGDAQQPTPSVTVGNVDGTISALCIFLADMVGAIVTRHRTLSKYLDAVNFPEGNPTADPTEETGIEQWVIQQKTSETNIQVEFSLSTPMDFAARQLPARQIIANVCQWLAKGGYRGPYCGYTGTACFDKNNSPVSDPSLDKCGGRLTSCKVRFGENNQLPYGSYPAASLTST
jgi:lambda family phage minor tail protein L